MVSGRRLRVLSGILPALWLLCLCLRHGTTAPVKVDCPCADPSQCELITAPPRKELFAFIVEDSNWQKYDWSKITTVGLYTKYDPKLMCHAHSKGARIVLAVIYPVDNLTNPAARTAWIQQQVAQAKSWHMDGVNFDIEYPVSIEDAHYVVDLVKETAQAFKAYNPNAQITFDVGGVPPCLVLGWCYDYTALAEACDFLFLMDYDLLAAGPVAFPNSPLSVIKFAANGSVYIPEGIYRFLS
ncbi:di-N-acetylchitobiase-like [Patiria miniata]|uniref:GH18 domain-containing protein n=1 Tax=Patiria miniata TaxID=46514 RepID=A0A914BNP2_PATMI|nr:di-N-acetylchitobiase-like [Patiria miniata]